MAPPTPARRTRPSVSTEANPLLKRQMASISSTLLNASRKRDTALKERVSIVKSQAVPQVPVSAEGKATVVEVLKGGKKDGVWEELEEGEVIEDGDLVRVVENDGLLVRISEKIGDKIESDVGRLFRVSEANGFKPGVMESVTVKNEAMESKQAVNAAAQPANELQEMISQLKRGDQQTPVNGVEAGVVGSDTVKNEAVESKQPGNAAAHSAGGPQEMLRQLNDIQQTLVNKDPALHTSSSVPIQSRMKGNIHLADLNTMLQEIQESCTSFDVGTRPVDESGDLESFHRQFNLLCTSGIKQVAPDGSTALDQLTSPSIESPVSMDTEVSMGDRQERGSSEKIPSALLRYTILLQLEQIACPWKEVNDWTAQLFSNGSTDNRAEQHQDDLPGETAAETFSAAKRAHGSIGSKPIPYSEEITSKTKQDQPAHEKEEQAEHLHRVIVNNIAAGADKEDVLLLFYDYKYDIEYIELLEERAPKSRTQTAFIYMYSKHAATMASNLHGHIFGLIVQPRLATEIDL